MSRSQIEERVLERDNHKCVRCGKNAEAVHHILPRKAFPKYKNNETNLVSVCSKCHKFIHNQYGEPLEDTIQWYMQRFYFCLRVKLIV